MSLLSQDASAHGLLSKSLVTTAGVLLAAALLLLTAPSAKAAVFGVNSGDARVGSSNQFVTDTVLAGVGAVVTVVVTKPDASTITFGQRTDADSRVRGNVFASVINQVGTYTIQITSGADTGSTTFVASSLLQNTATLQTGNLNLQSASAANIGVVTRAAVGQTADLLQVQNSGGTALARIEADGDFSTTGSIASVNGTFSGTLGVTNAATFGGTLTVSGVSTFTGTLTANGGIATANGNINAGTGVITGVGSGLTTLNATNLTSGTVADVRLSGNVSLKDASNTLTGTTIFQNTVNSTAEVQVNTAAANPLFTVDSTNGNVIIGSILTDVSVRMLVLDSSNVAVDPTGIAGGVYYNTTMGKFRCFEGGTWKNCIPSPNSTVARTAVSDTNYTVLASDVLVAYTLLTNVRVVSLPPAASVANQTFYIKDETGTAAVNSIDIDPNGAETIDGVALRSVATNYGSTRIYSNGTAWFTF